jgi:hypothetical protein
MVTTRLEVRWIGPGSEPGAVEGRLASAARIEDGGHRAGISDAGSMLR